MASNIAHRVLHIVIREHAGCLGGFAADKRARLYRSYEIVEECEAQVYAIQVVSADWSPIAGMREAMTERIRRFAPGLIPPMDTRHNPTPICILTLEHIQRVYRKRLSEDRRNARRRSVAKPSM